MRGPLVGTEIAKITTTEWEEGEEGEEEEAEEGEAAAAEIGRDQATEDRAPTNNAPIGTDSRLPHRPSR